MKLIRKVLKDVDVLVCDRCDLDEAQVGPINAMQYHPLTPPVPDAAPPELHLCNPCTHIVVSNVKLVPVVTAPSGGGRK